MATQIMDMGWWLVAAVAVAVLGGGRLARLITHDSFPPAAWVRQKWTNLTKNHEEWTLLTFCHWCLGLWIMAVVVGTFLLTFTATWIAWAWWIFWGWLALGYLSSIIVSRDEPADGQ